MLKKNQTKLETKVPIQLEAHEILDIISVLLKNSKELGL